MIYIVDFGSQTCHLIGRRIRDLGAQVTIISPEDTLLEIEKEKPAGIILSGGPSSVYEKGAPTIDKKIFSLGIPILGICYGWQFIAQITKGKVISSHKEYGPSKLTVKNHNDLFFNIPGQITVWESHGDTVVTLPSDFTTLASTDSVEYAAVKHNKKHIYGIQFHPEMHHTELGTQILRNFVSRICFVKTTKTTISISEMIDSIKEQVGNNKVIGAFSGGTDSAVAGALLSRAIGKNFIPIYVDSGLMRDETLLKIQTIFPNILGRKIKVISAEKIFLKRLKGIIDPEEKRKVIGKLYIELFEKEINKSKHVTHLMQGTTYADFIHSKGTKQSAHIKSHHNVGGLPSHMKLKLIEPLKFYYTDQVREIGIKIGLPKDVVHQQPFPGPGHAVRILGEVTPARLEKQKQADAILVDEMKKSGWYEKVFQCWTVLTNSRSTAVKGDSRFFGDVIALRIINSKDRMTADWSKLPYDLLARLSTRIVNEVPEISRVVYDITTKPPATMEWE